MGWGAEAEAALRGLARTSEVWGGRLLADGGWLTDPHLEWLATSLVRAAAGYEASSGRLD